MESKTLQDKIEVVWKYIGTTLAVLVTTVWVLVMVYSCVEQVRYQMGD